MLCSTRPAHQKVNVVDMSVSGSEVLCAVCGLVDKPLFMVPSECLS